MVKEEYLHGTVQKTRLAGFVKFLLNLEYTVRYNEEACPIREVYLSTKNAERYVDGNKINLHYVRGRALARAGYAFNGSGKLVKKVRQADVMKQPAENKGDENTVSAEELDRIMAESGLEDLASKSGSGDAIHDELNEDK